MLLSIFIIAIVGLVAYFHYVQGFFSATISAIVAVLAAVLAVSYHETIVVSLLGGKFADVAPGMTLCVLFAVIYLLIRTASDTFVPGNLRLPVLADKVGAGVMGIVAGVFAGGVVAIAAQSLPFGASVGGFSRFETESQRDVMIPTSGQSTDTFVYDVMKDHDIERNRSDSRHKLYLPADEMVLNTVQAFSNNGSLAGSRALHSVHPDYLEELFLSNVGIQIGAKRTAINIDKQQEVSVPDKGVFTAASVTQSEGELEALRKRTLPPTLAPKGNKMILVVRVQFDRKATDSDSKVRFSTGSARLVANGTNYYPEGTLEGGKHMYANALDDFLIAESGADLVYVVEKEDVLKEAKAPPEKQQLADGVFIEVKRLGRVDLSGKKVIQGITPPSQPQVVRKSLVVKAAGATGRPAGGTAEPQAEAVGPLSFGPVRVGGLLPHRVATGTADKTGKFETLGATGALADGKFGKLDVNGSESSQRISNGPYAINELGAPQGQLVVQVKFTPRGDDPWAFASQVASYVLVDQSDQQYQPRGVYATVKTPDGGDRLVARYDANANVGDLPQIEGRPTDVWIVYTAPTGTQLKQVTFNGQVVGATNLTVQ
jgi:hypothetical protein